MTSQHMKGQTLKALKHNTPIPPRLLTSKGNQSNTGVRQINLLEYNSIYLIQDNLGLHWYLQVNLLLHSTP